MLHLRLNNNILTIIYKLLNDALFIALVFFLLILTAEGFLPGVVSSRISFTKIILALATILIASYFVASYAKINLTQTSINKKTAFLLLFIMTLLIFNSLWKLNIILNLFILIVVIISSYYTYKLISENSLQ